MAIVGALILWSIGLGAYRLRRLGGWYYGASGALLMLLIVADSLHWDLVMVAGYAVGLVLGAYGTVMRFRRPKQERRPS